jgi:MarR family transcriptional regulator, organic hydroperoxide resistance regulator
VTPPSDATPGFLVWRLSMKWRAAVDRAVAPLGLTHAQYSLLASLRGLSRAGHAPSQRQLADFTGLDPIYVSKLARALEAAGLVERTPDPTDTRAVRLTLSAEGATVVDRAIAVVHGLLEELTAPLGGTSGKRTRSLMRDLHALLAVPTPPTDRSEP